MVGNTVQGWLGRGAGVRGPQLGVAGSRVAGEEDVMFLSGRAGSDPRKKANDSDGNPQAPCDHRGRT